MLLVIIFLLSLIPSVAEATCSGSGLTWSCTAGSTAVQINTAIDSATDGATVTLANGTYSATGIDLGPRNGITVICESVGGCSMTGGDVVFSNDYCPSGAKTNLMRISGFNFTTAGNNKIWIYCTVNINQLRLDHLDFGSIGAGNTAIFIGEAGGGPPFADRGDVYGVADHINCHSTSANYVCFFMTSGGDTWTTGNAGSANAFFFEDSICNFTVRTDFTKSCVDNWRAHALVLRFNTVTGSNLRAHSYCHYGPEVMEVYGNSINTASVDSPGSWDVHLQGSGEQYVWGNLVTPDDPGGSLRPMATQSYRSDSSSLPQGDCSVIADGTQTGVGSPSDPNDGNRTPLASYYGYPYWHQPGRDGEGTLKPMYSYLNRTRGTGAVDHLQVDSGDFTGLSGDCANNNTDRVNCHIQLNRDLYREDAAFNGTSGVGVGTLASRPATCTATPEASDAGSGGVGYWATDQGSWKQTTPTEGQDVSEGVLYRCSSTNTWTVAYTPYTYPHPLQGFVLGGGARNQGMSGVVRGSGKVRFSNP